jgi:hypothetical protein
LLRHRKYLAAGIYGLCTQNYTILVEEDLNKWQNMPYSWMVGVRTTKKSLLRAGDVVNVVEHLPSMLKALNSIPTTAKEKKVNSSQIYIKV